MSVETAGTTSKCLSCERMDDAQDYKELVNDWNIVVDYGWLEFNVPFQHKYGYIRDEVVDYVPEPHNHHHHNRFMAPFPRPPGWAGARRELLDFMVQREINSGRHIDHPAGRHSIRTNHCPHPPPSHIFFTGQMPFLPPNQQCQSNEGNQIQNLINYKWVQQHLQEKYRNCLRPALY